MKKLFMATAIISLLSVSCSETNKLSAVMNALKEKWALQSLIGQTDLAALFPNKTPQLSFDTEAMKVTGNTGCNNFNGAFNLLKGGKLNIFDLAMTKMACPGNGENLFTNALKTATNFKLNNNVLSLLNGKEEVMSLIKATE